MMEMLKADTNLDCIDLLFHAALTSPILRLACLAARSGCPEARRGTRAPRPAPRRQRQLHRLSTEANRAFSWEEGSYPICTGHVPLGVQMCAAMERRVGLVGE